MADEQSPHGATTSPPWEHSGEGSSPPPRPTLAGFLPRGTDAELRRLLCAYLSPTPGGLLLHEVGLAHGAARVDVLHLSPTELHGYELKAERDTLRRLPWQVELYGAALERCTLVVAEPQAQSAQALLPLWWGVLVAVRRSQLHLHVARHAQPNPEPNALAAARLLWRGETLEVLEVLAVHGGSRGWSGRRREALYLELTSRLGTSTHAAVRLKLLERRQWLSVMVRQRATLP